MAVDGDVLDLDSLIERLVATAAIGPKPEPGAPVPVNSSPRAPRPRILEWELSALCATVTELLRSEPAQPNVPAPVHVIGDLHGQLKDLLRYFDRIGWPGPECSYLFLGDYVDRGKFSIETIALLYALKAKHPKQMTLLRGNHEASSVNRIYGFYDDCKRRFGSPRVWKRFNTSFEWLPITALIADRIFCLHGGLSPDGDALEIINAAAERPIEPEGAVLDLLWSDPDKDITGWGENDRGMGHTFGPDVVAAFLKRHDLDLICRGHQVIEDGYEFFGDRSLVTIFSAPNYCGEFDNAGASLNISEDLLCSFDILKPNLLGTVPTTEATGRKTDSEQNTKKTRAKSGKSKGRGK